MNLDTEDPVGARNRAILYGVVTLVVLGVVVGLLVGWLGSRAVDSTGIDEVQAPRGNNAGQADGEEYEDFTAGPTDTDEATETEPSEPTESTPTSPSKSTDKPKSRDPVLRASPSTASGNEQVTLSGRFPGLGSGVTLMVERKEGNSWTGFADVTTTTESRGRFSTWIWTGQEGRNLFRVTAETGESTPPVVVMIS